MAVGSSILNRTAKTTGEGTESRPRYPDRCREADANGQFAATIFLSPVPCNLYPVNGHRQRVIGLAIVALLILLFAMLRHFWSAP